MNFANLPDWLKRSVLGNRSRFQSNRRVGMMAPRDLMQAGLPYAQPYRQATGFAPQRPTVQYPAGRPQPQSNQPPGGMGNKPQSTLQRPGAWR